MTTTLVVSAVLLVLNMEAQERPFCLLNATTLPGASHTQEQLLSLPINNETPDTRFLNNWAWWGDPLNSQWPQNVPLEETITFYSHSHDERDLGTELTPS